MECLNVFSESGPIMHMEEGSYVFLDLPAKLDPPPKIDESFINNKYVKISTPESVTNYFSAIKNDNVHFRMFNGVEMESTYYGCDYCNQYVEDDVYYCYHCHKHMCKLCYEEIDEETAIKNGAKNYKAREAALNECRSFHKIQFRPIYYLTEPYDTTCNICHEDIDALVDRYSVRYSNYNTYDVCMDCYANNDEAKSAVEIKKLKLVKKEDRTNYLFNYTDFNSLCYWLPIIEDNDGSAILMNLNPDDKNYRKICLQSRDDHGRSGYFIIYNESITLDVLLQKLKDITDKGYYEYEDCKMVEDGVYENYDEVRGDMTWHLKKTIKEPVYKTVMKKHELYSGEAIQELMRQFNMQVHYG